MNMLKAGIAGAIAALIGAIVWALISKSTGYEVGIIAWGIGAVVGTAVFIASGRVGGAPLGILAVILAVAGIAAGKFAATWLLLDEFLHDDERHIAVIADELLYEQAEAGGPVVRPQAATEETESWSELYPREIWSRAENRWNAMTPEEQANLRIAPLLANKSLHLVYLADEIVYEWADAGTPMEWPEGSSIETALHESDYPAEVWAEAQSRWSQLSADAQHEFQQNVIETEVARFAPHEEQINQEMLIEGFVASLGVFDVIWLGLAVFSAFRIGSIGSEQSAESA